MSVCLGTDPSPQLFASWAKKQGIFLHPDVAFLVPTKTMGAGVFARRQLPKETVIVSCPFSSSISPYAGPSTVEAPCVKALNDTQVKDNVLYVTLRFMAEVLRPSSPWVPWLKTCPRMLDHLFGNVIDDKAFCSATCTSLGTVSTRWTCLSQQLLEMNVSQRWGLAEEIMKRYPEHWPEDRATFPLFCECLALVLSRNFHRENVEGREGPYLLPGLDMVNHSFEANAILEIRGGGRKHSLTFCLVASKELRRGEQVLLSYGKIGAARFAVEFQFVTDSVVGEDMLRFSVDVIVDIVAAIMASGESTNDTESNVRMLRQRVERLQRLGFLFDEGLYISRLPRTSINRDLDAVGSSCSASTWGAEIAPATVKDVQRFFNVFHLMTVSTGEFDHLIHTINRDWQVKRTDALMTLASRVIAMRAEAAHLQLNLVQEQFSGEEHSSRRRLMETVLNSELQMLDTLQEYVKGMC
ncbi:SET domain containing protein, putative [Trypanosoma equiperdum]|uniref:SET domain-containing protein n=2 Tax=Trypanozoon TaxID=39700 RepID=Q38A07_TRYB2|nr:hypothetical protein, conserved [Trypanosoma brucei brucei TREU927]EAN78363.1 hypothetical protein, conserved [Trypanosoma brucei brucei TREU927]SCU69283.1 SET domain containing protein, putative [Trypanosoma equiperdum]